MLKNAVAVQGTEELLQIMAIYEATKDALDESEQAVLGRIVETFKATKMKLWKDHQDDLESLEQEFVQVTSADNAEGLAQDAEENPDKSLEKLYQEVTERVKQDYQKELDQLVRGLKWDLQKELVRIRKQQSVEVRLLPTQTRNQVERKRLAAIKKKLGFSSQQENQINGNEDEVVCDRWSVPLSKGKGKLSFSSGHLGDLRLQLQIDRLRATLDALREKCDEKNCTLEEQSAAYSEQLSRGQEEIKALRKQLSELVNAVEDQQTLVEIKHQGNEPQQEPAKGLERQLGEAEAASSEIASLESSRDNPQDKEARNREVLARAKTMFENFRDKAKQVADPNGSLLSKATTSFFSPLYQTAFGPISQASIPDAARDTLSI